MKCTNYNGYQITYTEERGKIVVLSAYYCGIQCSYRHEFDSMQDLKNYVDNGGWSVGLSKKR